MLWSVYFTAGQSKEKSKNSNNIEGERERKEGSKVVKKVEGKMERRGSKKEKERKG